MIIPFVNIKITIWQVLIASLSSLVLTALIVFLWLMKKKARLVHSLNMSLFLVKMPKYKEKEEQDIETKNFIEMMEQVFSNFVDLKNQPTTFWEGFFRFRARIALEIASEVGGKDIAFYIAVPSHLEAALNKYIQGIYPEAVIEKVPEDYTIFEPNCKVAASWVKLKNPYYFPIKTYQQLPGDTIGPITNALSNIHPDEGAGLQIILQPTSLKINKFLEDEKKLENFIKAGLKRKGIKGFLGETWKAIQSSKNKKDQESKPEAISQEKKEAVIKKLNKPMMAANIRLVGVSQTKLRAQQILSHLESSLSQFRSPDNELETQRIKGKRKLLRFIENFSYRNFQNNQEIILNLEELVSLYHLPSPEVKSPYIKRLKTREVPPPSELPEIGPVLIGKVIFRNHEKNVYFASREDRRRHFYIIGQTGTGKSSLLREMIRQDIEAGEGVGVIDPHGELIEQTLANIPKQRVDDVILFEPFDTQKPCGLNMLEWKTPEEKDFAVSEMIGIFEKLFPPEIIGPMFEHYMRNAMLALMADKEEPGTLVEIPRIFTDENFMKIKLTKVEDPVVRNFWEREWKQTTGSTRSDMLGYVVSKVGRFVENEMMRNIIGQSRSSFNFQEIMDQGKIFLANLSKGQTGEINAFLLGLILVSKLQMSALRRAAIPEEQRRDFYLYIDEFQNFTTKSIASILSEARKYRLCLILAHQFMPQLPEDIRNAVIGNVGTMAAFRIGAEDAEFMERQFAPEFSKLDLLNLDNFNVITKMMVNGTLTSPFRFRTIPPKEGNKKMVLYLKRLSKLKYGRAKEQVEREIRYRARLGEL